LKYPLLSFVCISSLTVALTACHPEEEESEGNSSTVVEDAQLPSSINFKNLTGGTFTMGDDADDAPETRVTVSDFQISETEITNDQYLEFLNDALDADLILVNEESVSNDCRDIDVYEVHGTGDALYAGSIYIQLYEYGNCIGGDEENDDNRSWITYDDGDDVFELVDDDMADWPVNWVSWHGAAAFADFYDVDLPTEAQWEFAAHGGEDLVYPTDDGELSDSQANYGDSDGDFDEDDIVVEVETYDPNPYGIYDMAGNVYEWCSDYYDAGYYGTDTSDPENTVANNDQERVRRGGAWNSAEEELTTQARSFAQESVLSSAMGFRIVINED